MVHNPFPSTQHAIFHLKFGELLDFGGSSSWEDSENVESDLTFMLADKIIGQFWGSTTYSLAQRSTLSNNNLVTILDTERGRDMCCKVFVSFLVSRVFRDKVKIFSADDECAVHFCRDDSSSQDTATNGYHSGEWAFFV